MMNRISTLALAAFTSFSVYATGPDSSKITLPISQLTTIAEPEEWSNPKVVALKEETAFTKFRQRLQQIWNKHFEELRKDQEEVMY